jgi:glycosyltransferase involved in cell wall biosynthesis
MLPLTVWMNMPSFHQSDLFRALHESGEVDLQVVFAKKLTDDRAKLGWQSDLEGFPYRMLDERRPVRDALRLAWAQRDRIHMFGGLWAELPFTAALVSLFVAGGTYTIYAEAPDPGQPRSASKRLLQAAFGRTIVRRVSGMFPVSRLGADFFRRLGAREQVMYPFGYFRATSNLARDLVTSKGGDGVEVLFVGQLIHRKGVDLLLQAMRPLFEEHRDLALTLIGEGELSVALQRHVAELGLSDRVNFVGAISAGEIPRRLSLADLLVLPSRWDGWGMVVNESLSVGVPVVASDRCGAADLIQDDANGYVFRSGDAASLRACLTKFLSRREEWPSFKTASSEVGGKISTQEVAPYLIKCLKNLAGILEQRPTPPWPPSRASYGRG